MSEVSGADCKQAGIGCLIDGECQRVVLVEECLEMEKMRRAVSVGLNPEASGLSTRLVLSHQRDGQPPDHVLPVTGDGLSKQSHHPGVPRRTVAIPQSTPVGREKWKQHPAGFSERTRQVRDCRIHTDD